LLSDICIQQNKLRVNEDEEDDQDSKT